MICAECWEPIVGPGDVNEHASLHQVGTDHLAIRACPRCYGRSHPAHTGRCGMPIGYLGVVSCYCVYSEKDQ